MSEKKFYILERRQFIPASIKKVFGFFENAGNLAYITPDWLNFSIKTTTPILMKKGTEIQYTIRWLGIPVRWQTLIKEYDPPHHFIDEQIKGPYRKWVHVHTFEEHDGGVLMTDRVTYILPFGLLGKVVHRLLVRKQLEQIFDYRRNVIDQYFKNGKNHMVNNLSEISI